MKDKATEELTLTLYTSRKLIHHSTVELEESRPIVTGMVHTSVLQRRYGKHQAPVSSFLKTCQTIRLITREYLELKLSIARLERVCHLTQQSEEGGQHLGFLKTWHAEAEYLKQQIVLAIILLERCFADRFPG